MKGNDRKSKEKLERRARNDGSENEGEKDRVRKRVREIERELEQESARVYVCEIGKDLKKIERAGKRAKRMDRNRGREIKRKKEKKIKRETKRDL